MPDANYTSPINIEQLLLTKSLEPLAKTHAEMLKRIEQYDVSGFNEAEVRSNIIDPIVRILGYDKDTIFSADLEHRLTFLGKQLKRQTINLHCGMRTSGSSKRRSHRSRKRTSVIKISRRQSNIRYIRPLTPLLLSSATGSN